jgi:Ion channel
MTWIGVVCATALIVIVLVDTFEVMILPRRIAHAFRPARLFYRSSWALWRRSAAMLPMGKWRHGFLSVFGPLSVFALVILWAMGLVFGFALLHWSLGTTLAPPRDDNAHFAAYLYFSGTTFFTLGYGDLVPSGEWGRVLSVLEAGVGFGFLAVVISFLPVLYQAFSRREITISLFDARAGSPPSAGELLRRMADGRSLTDVRPLLADWERWAAELLESHLSYPMLRFYRSQHDNQSWIAALTTILDTSALLIAVVESSDNHQARLTFAMARHAAVDLSLVSQTPPLPPKLDRLPTLDLVQLRERLGAAGVPIREVAAAEKVLVELRALYEPFVNALAAYFEFALPHFQPRKPPVDNWQSTAWTQRSPSLERLSAESDDEHFV